MRTVLVAMLACALAAAVPACHKTRSSRDRAQTKKVGGCEIETIPIGAGIGNPDEAPAGAAWIRVCSLEFAGNDLYRKAADDLRTLLQGHRVTVYTSTELMHVKQGPCWPPYSVELRVDLTEEEAGRLRKTLLANALANCRPVLERPDNYGTFFVSCGAGASDWWAVWYVK
jgi:hypothetical protein